MTATNGLNCNSEATCKSWGSRPLVLPHKHDKSRGLQESVRGYMPLLFLARSYRSSKASAIIFSYKYLPYTKIEKKN